MEYSEYRIADSNAGIGRANNKKITSCHGCKFDPSYGEQLEGVVCKSKKDCVDFKQYKRTLTYAAKAFNKSRNKGGL